MVCLPRGSEHFPHERGEPAAPPGRGFPHDLRLLWDVRGFVPVYIGLRQVPGEDGGDVLGAHAGQVQVDLWRPFDCGPWPWERLS
jgi:hypothetical protein